MYKKLACRTKAAKAHSSHNICIVLYDNVLIRSRLFAEALFLPITPTLVTFSALVSSNLPESCIKIVALGRRRS
jgi:hypothetical protein